MNASQDGHRLGETIVFRLVEGEALANQGDVDEERCESDDGAGGRTRCRLLQQALYSLFGFLVASLDKIEKRLHAAMRQIEGRYLERRGIDKAAQVCMQSRIFGAQQRKHVEQPGFGFKRNLAFAKGLAELFQSVAKSGEGRVIISGQKRDGRFVGGGKVRLVFRQGFETPPRGIEIR